MLEFAQKYLSVGFSIIPLAPNSKRPALESWAEFQQRRPNLDEAQQWWRNGSDYGVAVVCGKISNLVVLDIDDPEKFGVALKAIGETLPDTPIVRTCKGWHLYFCYLANRIVRRHDRLDDWGAELRGDGCYVVAPPTVIDGHRYHWATRKGKCMALGEVPIADCPKWLLDAFGVPLAGEQNEHAPVQLSQPIPKCQSIAPSEATVQLPDWAHRLIDLLMPYWNEGQRHNLSLSLAGVLAKVGVSWSVAEQILLHIASRANDQELKDRLRALQDTYERVQMGESVLAWEGLKQLVPDEVIRAIDALLPKSELPYQHRNGTSPTHITFRQWSEVFAEHYQAERGWLIEGLIGQGHLVVVNARPKVGKSIFLASLAASLVQGVPFLGKPTKECVVVYADFERVTETHHRLRTLGVADHPNLLTPEAPIGADALTELEHALYQLASETQKPIVLVLDMLADFLRPELRRRKANLNDYSVLSDVLQSLREMLQRVGVTIIATHHQRKGVGEEISEISEVDILGSTAISAKLDVVLHLAPDKTDAGTLWLIAEGNAIPKTTITFTIREDFRLERTEAPARTKEEKAARLILGELAMRPEGMAYGDMVALVREVGLTETEGAAKRLVDRVLSQLAGRMTCKQDGRQRVYRLKDQPDLPLSEGDRPPSGAPDGQEQLATSDNNIDFVANVANPQNANKNGDLISDRISDNPLTVVANPQGEATPIGDISDKSDKGSVVANVANPSASGVICDNSDNAYIGVACRQCEAVLETYPVNAPQPNQPKLVDAPITPTSDLTSSDEVRYVDTEQWLEELCAELSETSNEPNDNASLVSQPKPDRLACFCGGELRLFGKFYQCLRCDSPRIAACRYCGKVLQLTSDSHAECVGCGLPYTFDRHRRLWLTDFDAF
jgi:hypothetical protein